RTTRLSSSASFPKTTRPRHRTTAIPSVVETSRFRATGAAPGRRFERYLVATALPPSIDPNSSRRLLDEKSPLNDNPPRALSRVSGSRELKTRLEAQERRKRQSRPRHPSGRDPRRIGVKYDSPATKKFAE